MALELITPPEVGQLISQLNSRVRLISPSLRVLTCPPCPPQSSERLAQNLNSQLTHSLPEEYALFLKNTNGLEFDGKVFYGVDCDGIPRPVGGPYQIPRILTVNLYYKGCFPKASWLIIGRTDLDLVIYDAMTRNYLLVDEATGEAHQNFAHFPELFTAVFEYLEEFLP